MIGETLEYFSFCVTDDVARVVSGVVVFGSGEHEPFVTRGERASVVRKTDIRVTEEPLDVFWNLFSTGFGYSCYHIEFASLPNAR